MSSCRAVFFGVIARYATVSRQTITDEAIAQYRDEHALKGVRSYDQVSYETNAHGMTYGRGFLPHPGLSRNNKSGQIAASVVLICSRIFVRRELGYRV